MNDKKKYINIDRSFIQTEKEMFASWGKFQKPLVSINCITYNHERYIADALDGFLIQRTYFPFEILVHDDASDDSTPEIIQSYREKYPNIIKPIYQKVNQYSQGKRPSLFNLERAMGKYIAICEGDDYWVDSLKLEKQVNFLEKTLGCVLCFHNTYKVIANRELFKHDPAKHIHEFIIKEEQAPLYALPTQSVVFRNIFKYPRTEMFDVFKYSKNIIYGDVFFGCMIAQYGYFTYLNFTGAAYRMHESGMYSSDSRITRSIKSVKTRLEILKCVNDNKDFRRNLILKLNNDFYNILSYYLKNISIIKFIKYYFMFLKICIQYSHIRPIFMLHSKIFSGLYTKFRDIIKSAK